MRDLTGLRFNRLVVQWPVGKKVGGIVWLCSCDCGGFSIISASNLIRTGSCGCIRKEKAAATAQKKLERKLNKKVASGRCFLCSVILDLANASPRIVKRHSGYCNACRSKTRYEERAKSKIQRDKLREQVFELFGYKCSRCGFDDRRALQIDHKNGGGARDRKRFSQTTFIKYVLRTPDLFQVLCANCNWIKREENNEILYKGFSGAIQCLKKAHGQNRKNSPVIRG